MKAQAPTKPTKLEAPNIIKIDLKMLRPTPWQPPARLIVHEDECKKWGEDILNNGLRQIPVGRGKDGVYEIADGWQRKNWFEWLFLNGHPEYSSLPVNLQDITDEQMSKYPEITDESKKKMTVIDRAWSWKKRLADFPKTTQAEFAAEHGVTQSVIANTIRLLDLPESIQQDIISQKISVTHGIALLALKNDKVALEFAENVKNFGWSVVNLESNIKIYLAAQKPKLIEDSQVAFVQATIDTYLPVTPAEEKVTDGQDAEGEPIPPDNEPDEELENESGEEEATIPDCCEDCGNQDDCDRSYFRRDEVGTYSCENRKPIFKGTAAAEKKNKPAAKTLPVKTPPAKTPPPPAKKTPPVPEKPAAAAKPKWQRKLVLEEKKDCVMVTYGKAGDMPKFDKVTIDFDMLITKQIEEKAGMDNPLYAFMKKVEAEWLKEVK